MDLTACRAGARTPAPVRGQPHSHEAAEGREAKRRRRRGAGRRLRAGGCPSEAAAALPAARPATARGGALPGGVCRLHFVRVAAVRPEKQQSVKFGFDVSKLGFAFWKNSKYTSTYLGREPKM